MRHIFIVIMKNSLGESPRLLKECSHKEEAEEYVKAKVKDLADYMSTYYISIEEVWTNSRAK